MDLETAINPSTPANIYEKIEQYENENMDNNYNDAYNKIAQKYNTNINVLKDIQKWDLTKCISLFEKMKIKKRWNWYTKEDFIECKSIIDKKIEDYVTTATNNLAVQDSTKWELLLADWDPTNWPFDLIADMKSINKILFKDEIKIEPKFKDEDKNEEQTEENGNKESETNENIEKNNEQKEESNITTDDNNSQTSNDNNSQTSDDNINIKQSWNNNFQNSNFQIWNICLNNELQTWGNNKNNNNWWNNDWWFNTFKWNWNKWWIIAWGSSDSWNWNIRTPGWYNDLSDREWSEINNNWINKLLCPPDKYILAICVKLVPSWPRWPVWWTVYKWNFEEILMKIWDTLREIKENFIVLAWHWDEALDIDYKHVDLTTNFAFWIVLNKRKVFDFRKDDKSREELNKEESYFKWTPTNMVKLLKDNNIWNWLIKDADKNKYLLTNIATTKPQKTIKNNMPYKIDNTSSKWVYTVLERFSDYVWAINGSLDDILGVSKNMKKSARYLYEKSKIEY